MRESHPAVRAGARRRGSRALAAGPRGGCGLASAHSTARCARWRNPAPLLRPVLAFRLCRPIRLALVLTQGGSVSHARSWANREALPACDTYLTAWEALLASMRMLAWPGSFPSGRGLPPAQCEPDATNECAKQHPQEHRGRDQIPLAPARGLCLHLLPSGHAAFRPGPLKTYLARIVPSLSSPASGARGRGLRPLRPRPGILAPPRLPLPDPVAPTRYLR